MMCSAERARLGSRSLLATRAASSTALAVLSTISTCSVTARAEQFQLADVTYTATAENTQDSHFRVPVSSKTPEDWCSPVDYTNGSVAVQLDVLDKPSSTPTLFNVCFEGPGGAACMPYSRAYTGPGRNDFSSPFRAFWQVDEMDWSRGVDQVALILKDQDENKRQSDPLFYPTRLHAVITISTERGASTSGARACRDAAPAARARSADTANAGGGRGGMIAASSGTPGSRGATGRGAAASAGSGGVLGKAASGGAAPIAARGDRAEPPPSSVGTAGVPGDRQAVPNAGKAANSRTPPTATAGAAGSFDDSTSQAARPSGAPERRAQHGCSATGAGAPDLSWMALCAWLFARRAGRGRHTLRRDISRAV